MKAFVVFFKKEWLESARSGKLTLLGCLFLLFGVMNPAIAKLTPLLMELFADSLSESGMIVTEVQVNALTSWTQFFKNIPMALIVFLLTYSNSFTKEFDSGTLIPILTKGLSRYKVLFAKASTLLLVWTVGYWLCFGITYGYTAYFWDQSIVQNLMFSIFCWWLFGVWTIAAVILFSTLTRANTGVLLGTGSAVLASYLLGFIPKLKTTVPTRLMDGNSLIYGIDGIETYVPAIVTVCGLIVLLIGIALPIFNKKQL